MYSDSRKAKLNSFAHHRAERLFSNLPALRAANEQQDPRTDRPDLRQLVIAGIRGFVPAAPVVA